MQTPLEETLAEEESRRNSRRLDLMYVSSSNPVTPDIFHLADKNRDLDASARAQAAEPLNADITGTHRVFTPTAVNCNQAVQACASTCTHCVHFCCAPFAGASMGMAT